MNAMHTLRFSGKIVLLVGLLAFGAFALARESRPAHASSAEFYLVANPNGTAGSCADVAVTSVILFVGGPAQDLYLCAKNIDDPYGAAAFTLNFSYVSWLVTVQSASFDDPAFLPASSGLAMQWLGSTGRAVSCEPLIVAPNLDTGGGVVDGGCQSQGAIGPTSNVTLAKIRISPGINKTVTNLDFRGATGHNTQLVSTYFDPGGTAALIAATPPLLPVTIAPCGDFTSGLPGNPPPPDHIVTIQDILYLANKYGMRSTSPGWDPSWDMDGVGVAYQSVGIQDILIEAREYVRHCP